MKIIEPSVELWKQENGIAHAVRCARVCYKRESGNDEATYKRLIESKHYSVFRHASYYYIINKNKGYHKIIDTFINIVDSKLKIVGIDIKYNDRNIYIVVNGQFLLEHPSFINAIRKYQVDEDTFKNTEIGFNMLRYTFKVVTQISTSRELNRVSPNNIAEQSTRYVYEDGTLCCPHWININMISMNSINQIQAVYNKDGSYNKAAEYYLIKCQDKFDAYKYLINHFNVHRQDARGLLPIDTATICAYTYSIDEWRAIIDLRYYGTTGKPHENAKIIAGMIKNELEQLGYDFAKENTKRKHIIAQSVCNHPKLEYYYQANNSKRKNGHIKGKVVYDIYCICKCCKCRKLISKNKVAHGVNVNQLHYKYGITI